MVGVKAAGMVVGRVGVMAVGTEEAKGAAMEVPRG